MLKHVKRTCFSKNSWAVTVRACSATVHPHISRVWMAGQTFGSGDKVKHWDLLDFNWSAVHRLCSVDLREEHNIYSGVQINSP